MLDNEKISVVVLDILLLIDGTDTCSVSVTVLREVITAVGLLFDATTVDVADVAAAKVVCNVKVCLLLNNILVDVTNDTNGSPLPDGAYKEETVCAKETEYASLALLSVTVVCLLFSPTLAYIINAVVVCSAVMLTVVAEVRLPVDVSLILVTDFTKSLLDDVLTDDMVVISSLLDKAVTDNVEAIDTSLLSVMIGVVAVLLLILTLSEETGKVKINVLLDFTLAHVIGIVEFALVFNITLVDVTDGTEVERTDIGICSLLTTALIEVMDVGEAEIK